MDGSAGWLAVFVITSVIIWVAAVYSTGEIAGSRGHGRLAWYAAAVVFGPVAVLAALVAPYTPELVARATAAALSTSATPAVGIQARFSPLGVRAGTQPQDAQGRIANRSTGEYGLGRWEVSSSTDTRLPVGQLVTIARDGRVLVVRAGDRDVTLDIDSLRAHEVGGSLEVEGDDRLRLALRPLDGQRPKPSAESLGLI